MTKFMFNINYKTTPGNSVAVVGSCKELGEWEHGAKMDWTVSNNWKIELDIKNMPFEYKYQIIDSTGRVLIWEATQNRMFLTNAIIDQSRSVTINDVWEQPSNTHVELKVCLK
ncbi:starch binding domain containing protein [Entamoeba histolytica HM-1:IMSS-B]|nr:starch binding domain containing protein [Entamoeba histolytica KU27]EMH75373.1 starch binding domain containing protein [Entamoeba histolytica HM-1:IMSS-B]EMS17073.1 starch binding domain containing protein [Entamoeba histolytica HM-3:IMSS]ENY62571.1 starch binding domain containing protein [Entamoeba histolytica HM-1:IMSS-A]